MQSFYKNKNALVTGGAGFIGSHLAQKLCEYGAHVTILDDFSTGSFDNISTFCSDVTVIARDITSFRSCVKATKRQDIVFHTAAFVSVPESVKHPGLCEKINIEGTNNLLEACSLNNVPRFIFSSSASVYGNRNDRCRETDKPNPQSPYAKSKLAGETLCKEYAKNHKINTACLRYFNVYGDRQSPNGSYAGVVAKFKHNLLRKQSIVIYGDGKQKRDFIHVSKVVAANLAIGTRSPSQGDVFNIASGKSITLLKLLEKLEVEMNIKRSDLQFHPARKGDIFSSQANCRKFKELVH